MRFFGKRKSEKEFFPFSVLRSTTTTSDDDYHRKKKAQHYSPVHEKRDVSFSLFVRLTYSSSSSIFSNYIYISLILYYFSSFIHNISYQLYIRTSITTSCDCIIIYFVLVYNKTIMKTTTIYKIQEEKKRLSCHQGN